MDAPAPRRRWIQTDTPVTCGLCGATLPAGALVRVRHGTAPGQKRWQKYRCLACVAPALQRALASGAGVGGKR